MQFCCCMLWENFQATMGAVRHWVALVDFSKVCLILFARCFSSQHSMLHSMLTSMLTSINFWQLPSRWWGCSQWPFHFQRGQDPEGKAFEADVVRIPASPIRRGSSWDPIDPEASKDVGMPLSLNLPGKVPTEERRHTSCPCATMGAPDFAEEWEHGWSPAGVVSERIRCSAARPTHVFDHGAAYTGSWAGQQRQGYGVQAQRWSFHVMLHWTSLRPNPTWYTMINLWLPSLNLCLVEIMLKWCSMR